MAILTVYLTANCILATFLHCSLFSLNTVHLGALFMVSFAGGNMREKAINTPGLLGKDRRDKFYTIPIITYV